MQFERIHGVFVFNGLAVDRRGGALHTRLYELGAVLRKRQRIAIVGGFIQIETIQRLVHGVVFYRQVDLVVEFFVIIGYFHRHLA